MYNRDVNMIYYINANLPAAQSAYIGADNRMRWVGTSCTAPSAAPCVNRINNAAGNQVTANIVLKNQDIGRNWNFAFSASKADVAWPLAPHGLQLRRSEEHDRSRFNGERVVEQQPDPWRSQQSGPRLLHVEYPGHRYFASESYTKQ